MKYAVMSAAVLTAALVVSPASASMVHCSSTHLSAMNTMIAGMPDGPNKSAMNKHLAMVNAAMAKDGLRGCDKSMMEMRHDPKMSMMKPAMWSE